MHFYRLIYPFVKTTINKVTEGSLNCHIWDITLFFREVIQIPEKRKSEATESLEPLQLRISPLWQSSIAFIMESVLKSYFNWSLLLPTTITNLNKLLLIHFLTFIWYIYLNGNKIKICITIPECHALNRSTQEFWLFSKNFSQNTQSNILIEMFFINHAGTIIILYNKFFFYFILQ